MAQNFTDSVCYALLQLRMSDLKLKDWQQQAIQAVYDGNDILFCQVLSGLICLLSSHSFHF